MQGGQDKAAGKFQKGRENDGKGATGAEKSFETWMSVIFVYLWCGLKAHLEQD